MNEDSIAKRARLRRSAEERARWLKLYEGSGQSIRDFCRENDLPQSSFSHWRRCAQKAGRTQKPSLVEVRVTPASAATTSILAVKVHLPGGIELEVSNGADAMWLARLLRALQPAEA